MQLKNVVRFNGREEMVLTSALENAAEQYKADKVRLLALEARGGSSDEMRGCRRLAEQFERQERETRAVLEKLESHESTHTLLMTESD